MTKSVRYLWARTLPKAKLLGPNNLRLFHNISCIKHSSDCVFWFCQGHLNLNLHRFRIFYVCQWRKEKDKLTFSDCDEAELITFDSQ